jgi:hypothetical protein
MTVVYEKRVAVPKRMRVFLSRGANGCPAHVCYQRCAFRAERSLPVRRALRGGLHLPKAVRNAIDDVPHAPPMRIGKSPRIVLTLLNERVLRI